MDLFDGYRLCDFIVFPKINCKFSLHYIANIVYTAFPVHIKRNNPPHNAFSSKNHTSSIYWNVKQSKYEDSAPCWPIVHTDRSIDDKGRQDESPYRWRTKTHHPRRRFCSILPGQWRAVVVGGTGGGGRVYFCAADQRVSRVLSVDTDFTSGGILQREAKRTDTFDTIYKRSDWAGTGITK